MTSREFIQRWYGVKTDQPKSISSIYKSPRGDIFSYGAHYPLLFRAGGLNFRNTAGYSATTAKHLSWCWDMANVNVELRGCNMYSWRNREYAGSVPQLLDTLRYCDTDREIAKVERAILKSVMADLQATIKQLNDDMASKKRKDTQIYQSMADQLERVQNSYATVKAVL